MAAIVSTIRSLDVIPLAIPFTDGSSGTGLMPSKWTHLQIALVRIETDDGLVGWGDGFAYSCLTATVAAIRDMVAPLVIGKPAPAAAEALDALNLELQLRLHLHGRYGITMFAISAVDIALWDIAAKRAGRSLAHFLSDAPRATIPAYASLVRYGDPALVTRFCEMAVEDGYRDVKLHEITLPAIEAGRAATGDDVRLTTDVNCNWSLASAHEMMPHMKRLGLYWVEEPVFPPDDAATLSGLERQYDIAIASGENACTAVEFARTVPAITFPQPSVIKVGGISEFLRVCDLAQIHGKTIMPHAPYFGPGYWATAQLIAAREECALFERFYIEPEAFCGHAIPLPKDGFIDVPDAPGLGFVPDEVVIKRYRLD